MVKPEDSLSQSPGSKPVFRQLTLQGLFAKKLKVDTESAHFGGATRIEKTKDKKQELQEALQSLQAEVETRIAEIRARIASPTTNDDADLNPEEEGIARKSRAKASSGKERGMSQVATADAAKILLNLQRSLSTPVKAKPCELSKDPKKSRKKSRGGGEGVPPTSRRRATRHSHVRMLIELVSMQADFFWGRKRRGDVRQSEKQLQERAGKRRRGDGEDTPVWSSHELDSPFPSPPVKSRKLIFRVDESPARAERTAASPAKKQDKEENAAKQKKPRGPERSEDVRSYFAADMRAAQEEEVSEEEMRRRRREQKRKYKAKWCEEHNRQVRNCTLCAGPNICLHGRQRYFCVPCAGKGICPHARRRGTCKTCANPKLTAPPPPSSSSA